MWVLLDVEAAEDLELGQPSPGVPGHAEVADRDRHVTDDLVVSHHIGLQREPVPGEGQIHDRLVVAEVRETVLVLWLHHVVDHWLTFDRV
jgi:hypothetical protein